MYPVLSLAQALSGGLADPGVCRPESSGGPGAARSAATSPSDVEVLFIGSRGGMEEDLLKRHGIAYASVNASPVTSRFNLGSAAGSAAKNVRGVAQAVPILKKFKPDVVVATGGYTSVPPVLAAAMLRSTGVLKRVKIALIEPNVAPGRANRLLATFADEVWGAYEQTAQYFPGKFVLTGVPVRPALYAPPARKDARARLGLDPQRTTILAFGGSQGARTINVAVSAMVARRRLPADWQVLHVAGTRDFEWMLAERKAESNRNRYVLEPYLEDMAGAYAAADVAVCRSGASTLAELATAGLPSILVPYPHAAGAHQRLNAQVFVDAGAAVAIENAKLDADSLYWRLTEVMEPATHRHMQARARELAHPRALSVIVERLIALQHRPKTFARHP
jgi:UDP-N-acetylglucosamine--N-acetylmuramyl-(pentapeptide) pyrophosphoryl-undecaprenol N-acetylglucosamine transferase